MSPKSGFKFAKFLRESQVFQKLPIEEILIDQDILHNINNEYQISPLNSLVVSDQNTFNIAKHINGRHLILQGEILPTLEYANLIKDNLANYEYIFAVGSGTINDLVKFATFALNKRYISIPTAPSMNGYASSTASIIDKTKKSIKVLPPKIIICDTAILASAPLRLIKAGVGDSMCRTTVENDVILSHYLLHTPRLSNYFAILRKIEAEFLDVALKCKSISDIYFINALMRTLIISGIVMADHNSSVTASQGEHIIAHYMHAFYPNKKTNFHGEEIAVTTIIMEKLQQDIIKNKIFNNNKREVKYKYFLANFAKENNQNYIKNYDLKKIDEIILKKSWQKIEDDIISSSLGKDVLMNLFLKLNISTSLEDLGWDNKQILNAIEYGFLTRDRFTFLDLI